MQTALLASCFVLKQKMALNAIENQTFAMEIMIVLMALMNSIILVVRTLAAFDCEVYVSCNNVLGYF